MGNETAKAYETLRYETLCYETVFDLRNVALRIRNALLRRLHYKLFLLFLAPCGLVRSTVAMHDVKCLGVA